MGESGKNFDSFSIRKDLLKLKIIDLLGKRHLLHGHKSLCHLYEVLDLPHREKMVWAYFERFLRLDTSHDNCEIISDNGCIIFRVIDRNFTPLDLYNLCCLFGYKMSWNWHQGALEATKEEVKFGFQESSAINSLYLFKRFVEIITVHVIEREMSRLQKY